MIGTHVYIYVPILAYFLASSAYLRMRFRGVTASEWFKAFVLSGLFFYISESWYFRLVAALSSPSFAAWGVAGPKQLTRDPLLELVRLSHQSNEYLYLYFDLKYRDLCMRNSEMYDYYQTRNEFHVPHRRPLSAIQ